MFGCCRKDYLFSKFFLYRCILAVAMYCIGCGALVVEGPCAYWKHIHLNILSWSLVFNPKLFFKIIFNLSVFLFRVSISVKLAFPSLLECLKVWFVGHLKVNCLSSCQHFWQCFSLTFTSAAWLWASSLHLCSKLSIFASTTSSLSGTSICIRYVTLYLRAIEIKA